VHNGANSICRIADISIDLGVGALGLPRVDGIAMQKVFATQAVLAIFLLFLPAALFLLFAFLAAIAHGKICPH
jgi:hypothetical protein